MTYTILAVDRKSGEVGIGITTGSINVGGLAPFFSIHGDVATSQAYARRELGAVMMRTLNEGGNSADALAAARADDGGGEHGDGRVGERGGAAERGALGAAAGVAGAVRRGTGGGAGANEGSV